MRKLLLSFFAVALAVVSVNAQIKKGSVFLGGNLSGSTQTTKQPGVDDVVQNGFGISPVVGKFIKDNLVVGGRLNFGIGTQKSAGDKYNSKSYGAGVFVRKYKNIGSGGFYIFIQGDLNVDNSVQEAISANPNTPRNKIKRLNIGLNANPGISFAVSKKLHLESGLSNLASLNYFREKREPTSITTTGFGLATSLNNASSNIYVGFRVLLGKS